MKTPTTGAPQSRDTVSTSTAPTFTPVPHWTLTPEPGTAACEAEIPDELRSALDLLADDCGLPLRTVLLAAHAKVLGALSGERDVTCGYVAVPGGTPLSCRLMVDAPSWRALLIAAHRAEPPAATDHDQPDDEAGAEPDAVFDPHGADGTDDTAAVLRVSVRRRRGGRYTLRLRYRTEVLDAACAARIAGYHLTALWLVVADPDAAPGPQSLVGAAELRDQLTALAGPPRELPALRAHQLFEQRARAHPDAVAAVYGNRPWTYGELNAHANRLAHALLARGLRREEAVAVVSERTPGWMAAVLAVFKAGGAYLPVEPHFPADRITTMLARASCRFVMAEPGSATGLDRALVPLPEVRTVAIGTADAEALGDRDPQVPVPADSLAYIYFTSGSTGEPKGVMCEHAGMLNHLYAKIDDLGIGERDVVAQTAPQCFDISLWQLLAGPLAGGRTLLVEQEAVMDVERFLDTLTAGRATVLQVVPSYLEALLFSLERRPRELPHLRRVSVTGEAVKRALVERWFAVMPGIPLVNAYGLTETSDDTNHEVMDGVPDSARIPLGRPVANVRVHVLGADLEPVPLGAPGEIVFSGVCVGRGYVGDPERTRLAFTADPYDPAGRRYRSGDRGRWLPDGKLDFLGRRDTQVKIRGFRIELAEIESTLLRLPGIREAAVVVAGPRSQEPFLAAFYTGAASPVPDGLRDRLSTSLPAYMVPAAFHRLSALPVTDNGKTDLKALRALAGERTEERSTERTTVQDDAEVPATEAERRLRAVWSNVLDLPANRIGLQDRFFDLGGTSLSALRVVIALDREISFDDLTHHPGLADLARLMERRAR
ncbi:amino acid adenylation domain-containing protein [Streptomyces virginiae]|uniref:amino acid adenylation domain-containing protein n=1 Tax=Streptomyces virginiae TaxID=1961 RepID=UPI0035D561F9